MSLAFSDNLEEAVVTFYICFLAESKIRRSIPLSYLSVQHEATSSCQLTELSIKTGIGGNN